MVYDNVYIGDDKRKVSMTQRCEKWDNINVTFVEASDSTVFETTAKFDDPTGS